MLSVAKCTDYPAGLHLCDFGAALCNFISHHVVLELQDFLIFLFLLQFVCMLAHIEARQVKETEGETVFI